MSDKKKKNYVTNQELFDYIHEFRQDERARFHKLEEDIMALSDRVNAGFDALDAAVAKVSELVSNDPDQPVIAELRARVATLESENAGLRDAAASNDDSVMARLEPDTAKLEALAAPPEV